MNGVEKTEPQVQETSEKMWRQWAVLGGFLVILLYCDVANATLPERFAWNPNRTIVIDRTAADGINSAGYYILPIDRTAFTVDRPVWLQQFDIAKVFAYDPNHKIAVHRVPVTVRIRKMTDLKDKSTYETVFLAHTTLNSTHEAKVNVFSAVMLKPNFVYEIRVKMPEKVHFMHNDQLETRGYEISRFFSKTIHLIFHQHNSNHKPGHIRDSRRQVSQGMVKRLHVKYSWF